MSDQDARIEEWKKQMEIHKRCFMISEDELQRFKEWDEKHLAEKHPTPKSRYAGAAGGRISWTFTPTGLGTFTSVKCALCNESITLTDCSDW